MTSKDKDQFDDEFEAFLHGRDDLSRHLRSLPQPEPSAELDAAILASVEADLARTGPSRVAANDPAMPGAPKHRPGFLTRWRAPVGMAASVLLTCLVVLRWQSQPDNPSSMMVAQAPQEAPRAPAAAAPQVAMAEQAQSQPASPSLKSEAADAHAAQRSDNFDGKQLAAKSSEKAERQQEKSPSALQPDMQIAGASAGISENKPSAREYSTGFKALAKESATPPAASSDMQIADASTARRAEPESRNAGNAAVVIGGAVSARADGYKIEPNRAASGSSFQIAQADAPEARAKAASPPAPAAAPAKPAARMEAEAAATPAPVRPAAAITAAPVEHPEKAKAWLALIEELLKADLRQDALAEWEKFRKAYPQYPVPEKLETRIKALKK